MAINKQILKVLILSLGAGCAGNKTLIEDSACSCDSLIRSFPEKSRAYVKDGWYEMGNKRIYKTGNRCYEAEKDSSVSRNGDTITIQRYWK